MVTVTGCKHCAVTCDSYYCVILNPKNFNDFSIKRRINCLSVKVKCKCNTVNYNGFCKCNISKNSYCSTVCCINCILKCCIFIAVYFSNCSSIQAIRCDSVICCSTICLKDSNTSFKCTAINSKLANLTLKSVYNTAGNGCHGYSTFATRGVDKSNVTTININSTCCGRCKRGG